jgi:hypothetical protein
MANGEDPSVEPMQASHTYCAVDAAPGIAQRLSQLSDRDDPVLPQREIGEGDMSPSFRVLPSFASHSGTKEGSAWISPPTQPLFVLQPRSERKKAAGLGPAAFGDA